MEFEPRLLGEFESLSGTLRATDPCYDPSSEHLRCIVPRARTGVWRAFVVVGNVFDGWGERVREIAVMHGSREPSPWQDWRSIGSVPVDSGQAGIFDGAAYPKGDTGEFGDLSSFYGRACALTLGDDRAGIVDGAGAVSSSGYGDGCYDVLTLEDEGQVVGVRIVFIE